MIVILATKVILTACVMGAVLGAAGFAWLAGYVAYWIDLARKSLRKAP